MLNSMDPDQTLRSGYALFAQACLSQYLGLLRHMVENDIKGGEQNKARSSAFKFKSLIYAILRI